MEPVIKSVGQIIAEMGTRPPCLRTTADCIELRASDSYWYPIDRDRCDTPEKVLGWVLHLSEKKWVTPRMLREFILATGVAVERNM